jgi:hypothetical protein
MRNRKNVRKILVVSIEGCSVALVAQVMEANLQWINDRFSDEFGVVARIGKPTSEPSVRPTVTRLEEG